MLTGSWRTTVAGILIWIVTIATAAGALLDDDPNTNPNWEHLVGLFTGGAALAARDNKVSSEQAGAK